MHESIIDNDRRPFPLTRAPRCDAFKEVFDHARDFTEKVKEGQLLLVDLEPLVYESPDYGSIEFVKIATQLTDGDANLRA